MSDISSLFPKVAIVADQMTAFGGADREMYSMLKVLPHADIFTIIFNKEKYPTLKNKVYTTFVQKLSKFLPKGFYRHLKVLTPIAYESIDLEGYDLVISISAGPAKGVITSLDQPHLAMVMTPPRSLWDKELNVRGSKLKSLYKGLSNILNTYMRVWDYSISKRVDYWSANSNFIKRKIKKTYQQDAEVIYPGVEKKYFAKVSKERIEKIKERYSLPEKFFLVVSRLYDYKRVDLAINASIKAKKQLYIIGEGPDKKYLEKIAGENNNIHFLGFLPSDDDVIVFYKLAEALLFCGIEDFGLTPVEAMASGTPVIAYEYGGVLETVKENITGQFFSNEDELTTILKDFDKTRYNQDKIIKQAKTFSEEEFIINFTKYLKYIYEQENAKKTPKESNLRVAISCEPLYKKGGAEVHLRHIINTFPNCELFTAYYDEEFVKEYFSDVKINHSFMQYLPKKDKLREVYLLLQPLAYGSFKFKGFDIVLSLSIAFSRFVKSKDIKHINLCMSPPKFLWQKSDRTLKSKEQLTGFKKFLFKIYSFFQDTFLEDIWKKWDRESAQRCTKIIANSKVVKKRIKKFYDMDSDVIYPPVDVSGIQSIKPVNRKENWFLYMGRVETYKGVKLAIDACVGLGYPLKIAGSGADLEAMREHVKKLNAKGLVKFLGFVSEEEKLDLLLKAKALIFPVRGEDFGIVPVEANAAGTPVIAYRDGGVTETISEKNPKTGVFFDEYNKKSLMKVMKNFNTEDYSQENCRKQAQNFASEIFEYKLLNYVKDALHSN